MHKQRSIKNLLLDRSFQLKYTAYIVGSTLLIALILGALIVWQMQRTFVVAESAVTMSADAIYQAKALHEKVESDAKINYADSPILLEEILKKEADDNARLNEKADHVKSMQASIVSQRRLVPIVFGSSLLVFLLVLTGVGIVITHKVAGPIFKMKRLVREVGEGRWIVPVGKLRKGDELTDFFGVFEEAVVHLRDRQNTEIAQISSAIESLAKGDDPVAKTDVIALLESMQQKMIDRVTSPNQTRP
jgi:hypothetical protein